MTDRDLTPAEARAEVEAFMGEGWMVGALLKGPEILGSTPEVCAQRDGVSLYGAGATLRAAVDALKTAWRDAVRPWVIAGVKAGHENVADNGDGLLELPATIVARVLKEEQ